MSSSSTERATVRDSSESPGWSAAARRRLFGIDESEVTFSKRGFARTDPRVVARLEEVGLSFVRGYHAALDRPDPGALSDALARFDEVHRGFAYEGAGMALELLDRVTPWRRNRLASFLAGPGDAHAYMVTIGAGWAWARLPLRVANQLRHLDPILGWLALDGFGFHEGFFHTDVDKFALQPGTETDDVAVVAPTHQERTSIAVLPFDNMSGDPGQDYFSDGMTEEIIFKLAQIDGLRVISRTTVEHYNEVGLDVPGIARELDVGFVLEGSVRKSESRIRVTAQLIQTSDDSHLWANNFDADLDDVFGVQETIAIAIVESLGIHLTDSDTKALAKTPTNDVAAYEAYLQGQALVESWNIIESLDASRTYFNQALAIDPGYANALAGLASAEGQTFRNFDSDPKRLERADEFLDRAQAIDPQLQRAFVARGELMAHRYDYPAASEQFQRAVDLDPENYFAWDLLCWSLAYESPPGAAGSEAACRRGLQVAPYYGALLPPHSRAGSAGSL